MSSNSGSRTEGVAVVNTEQYEYRVTRPGTGAPSNILQSERRARAKVEMYRTAVVGDNGFCGCSAPMEERPGMWCERPTECAAAGVVLVPAFSEVKLQRRLVGEWTDIDEGGT